MKFRSVITCKWQVSARMSRTTDAPTSKGERKEGVGLCSQDCSSRKLLCDRSCSYIFIWIKTTTTKLKEAYTTRIWCLALFLTRGLMHEIRARGLALTAQASSRRMYSLISMLCFYILLFIPEQLYEYSPYD